MISLPAQESGRSPAHRPSGMPSSTAVPVANSASSSGRSVASRWQEMPRRWQVARNVVFALGQIGDPKAARGLLRRRELGPHGHGLETIKT